MEPKTYVKKPIVVRAFQWDGTDEGANALIKAFPKAPIRVLESCPIQVQISTLEGMMLVSPGDFVIEGVKGEYYPCKPDIFAQSYDAVSGSGGPAKELLPPGTIPEPKTEKTKRSCNRHTDCDAADARVRAQGKYDWADHCHDDCCEDCFGS